MLVKSVLTCLLLSFSVSALVCATEFPAALYLGGEVSIYDAALGDQLWEEATLSASLLFRLHRPSDALAADAFRGQYLDAIQNAGVDLLQGDTTLLSAEQISRLSSIVVHNDVDGDGYTDRVHLSIPLQLNAATDTAWQPRWLEVWLYSTTADILVSDALPSPWPIFPQGWFRISFYNEESAEPRYVQGPITLQGPLEEYLDEAGREQLARLRLDQYASYVRELETQLSVARQAAAELQAQILELTARNHLLEDELATLQNTDVAELTSQIETLQTALVSRSEEKSALQDEVVTLQSALQTLERLSAASEARAEEAEAERAATLAAVERWRRAFYRNTPEAAWEAAVEAEKLERENPDELAPAASPPQEEIAPLETEAEESPKRRIRPRRFR